MLNDDFVARWRATEQEELARRVAALEQTNEALSQFAAVAAHDLRNPLGVIAGFAEMLLEGDAGDLNPDQEDLVRRISEASGRMAELIDDLLAFSRTSSAPVRRPVDARRLVDQATDSLAGVIATSGATVDVGAMPTVLADPTQLGEVFQNLIANAVKFVAPGTTPRVRIAAGEDARSWRFAVSDNGIGVDPAQREHVFGMFTRLHPREAYEGTGIGLAICKRVVETHGGRVWIEDAPGGGSRFCFTIAKPDPAGGR